MKKYYIELNAKQLQVYQNALELYSRLMIGQTDLIEKLLTECKCDKEAISPILNKLSRQIEATVKTETDLPETCNISYDMYREVLHFFNKDLNNVYSKRWLKSHEPIPEVYEIIN